jgi:hypothetical protein
MRDEPRQSERLINKSRYARRRRRRQASSCGTALVIRVLMDERPRARRRHLVERSIPIDCG